MKSLGLLALRVAFGGLLMGHGAQKLWGWYGGYGLEGTGKWMDSLDIKPGRFWANVAGWSEFGGGLMTALGLFHPLGPITSIAPMAIAMGKVHAGKPIWVTEGGAELPVTKMAIATALTFTGPGIFALDSVLRSRLGFNGFVMVAAGVAAGVMYALKVEPRQMMATGAVRTAEVRKQAEQVLVTAA